MHYLVILAVNYMKVIIYNAIIYQVTISTSTQISSSQNVIFSKLMNVKSLLYLTHMANLQQSRQTFPSRRAWQIPEVVQEQKPIDSKTVRWDPMFPPLEASWHSLQNQRTASRSKFQWLCAHPVVGKVQVRVLSSIVKNHKLGKVMLSFQAIILEFCFCLSILTSRTLTDSKTERFTPGVGLKIPKSVYHPILNFCFRGLSTVPWNRCCRHSRGGQFMSNSLWSREKKALVASATIRASMPMIPIVPGTVPKKYELTLLHLYIKCRI